MAYCHLFQFNFFSISYAFCVFHTCLKDTVFGTVFKAFAMFMELILVLFLKIWVVRSLCAKQSQQRRKIKPTRVKELRNYPAQVLFI